MRSVLAGVSPEPAHFDDYHRTFHDEHASVTETILRGFVDDRGRSSYDRLADEVDVSSGRVLDIGCADGVLLERLIARHPAIHVSGIDLSTREIARAQQRLPRANVDELVVATAEALPFSDDAFGGVVSHLVLMLIRDVSATLREVRRVLQQGKPFAFVILRAGDPSEEAMQLMRSIAGWVREVYPDYTPVNPGDVRVFSAGTLATALNDAGFSDVRIDDFIVERAVGIEDLHVRMGLLYYVGTLPEDARAHVHDRLKEWVGGRTIVYREAMRIVVAR